jgi:hypothetical protein
MLGTRGDKTRATAVLERLNALASGRYVSRYHLALAYVGLGDAKRAVGLLAEACDMRDPSVIHLGVEPRFLPLRSDPGYRTLMDRLGFL